ncbi:MAG: hypothetical protein ACLFV1_06805 [Thiohalophilus sp.]
MSESDKTRQKLVDSMRKTKSGATDNEQSDTTAEKTEPKKAEAVTSGNKADKAPRKTPKKEPENNVGSDGYQSRQRRVWPD